jgi:hypothetical protein
VDRVARVDPADVDEAVTAEDADPVATETRTRAISSSR